MFLYFLYSVIQDPITPSVIKNAWDVIKLRYFGYISQFSNKKIESINKKNYQDLETSNNNDEFNQFKTS